MKKYKLNRKKFASFIGELFAGILFYVVFVGGALAIIASM